MVIYICFNFAKMFYHSVHSWQNDCYIHQVTVFQFLKIYSQNTWNDFKNSILFLQLKYVNQFCINLSAILEAKA